MLQNKQFVLAVKVLHFHLLLLCLHISRLMINNSMDEGTQLPYIRQAVSSGYGVVVLNTNDNKPNVAVSTCILFIVFKLLFARKLSTAKRSTPKLL